MARKRKYTYPQEPVLSVRLTPAEREIINQAAQNAGVSRHAYMRQKILRDLPVASAVA